MDELKKTLKDIDVSDENSSYSDDFEQGASALREKIKVNIIKHLKEIEKQFPGIKTKKVFISSKDLELMCARSTRAWIMYYHNLKETDLDG